MPEKRPAKPSFGPAFVDLLSCCVLAEGRHAPAIGEASEPGIDPAGETADSLYAHVLGVCLWPCSRSEQSSATEDASMSSLA